MGNDRVEGRKRKPREASFIRPHPKVIGCRASSACKRTGKGAGKKEIKGEDGKNTSKNIVTGKGCKSAKRRGSNRKRKEMRASIVPRKSGIGRT